MEVDIDDLRSHKRQKKQHSIVISYHNEGADQPPVIYTGTTEDISESGLKIVARYPLPLETIVPLEVKILNSDVEFGFEGQVKWCLEVDELPTYFIGVKLIKIIKNSHDKWVELANS